MQNISFSSVLVLIVKGFLYVHKVRVWPVSRTAVRLDYYMKTSHEGHFVRVTVQFMRVVLQKKMLTVTMTKSLGDVVFFFK